MNDKSVIVAVVSALWTLVSLAETPGDIGLPVFAPEQVQGETRVTLLEVSRVTSFSSEHLVREAGNAVRAIPGLKLVYRVEHIVRSDSKDLHEGGITVLVAGAPLSVHPMVVAGGNSVTEPVREQLQTGFQVGNNQKGDNHVVLRYEYLRGLSVPLGNVELLIRVGFDKLHTFRFNNVPIR